MSDICGQCGKEYQRIASHWSRGSCDHPDFTQHQKEIVTGLLMGDGTIDHGRGKNPRLQSQMISPDYLKYVDEQFGIFGKGVKLKITARESAKDARERGFSTNAKEENYHDVYGWTSMAHPELQEFSDWYRTGKKVWPEDISLTPTVLKHWYCGDGSWDNNGKNNRIRISMANEIYNLEKVSQMFENAELPVPSNYNISDRTSGGKICEAQFTVEKSRELWKYMGEPLPDFEYKWPEEYS